MKTIQQEVLISDLWDNWGEYDRATSLRSNKSQAVGIDITFWKAWEYAKFSFTQLPRPIQNALKNVTKTVDVAVKTPRRVKI